MPVIFLNHLAAVLDNWDPRVIDGIAAKHRVIVFDNRGIGASAAPHRDSIEAMAHRRHHLHPGARPRSGRSAWLLPRRHGRPGDRAGGTAARAQARSSPARVPPGARASTRSPRSPSGTWSGRCHPPGSRSSSSSSPGPRTGAGRQGVPGAIEGAHGRSRQGDLGPVASARSSRPFTAGDCSSRPTCPASSSRSWSQTAIATGWCPQQLRRPGSASSQQPAHDLPRRGARRHLPVPRGVRRRGPGLPGSGAR